MIAMVAHKGFTLVEVMVAGIIFSLATVGIFASLAAIRQPAQLSDKNLVAAYCGQQVLESLRSAVEDDPVLSISFGTHTLSGATLTPYGACAGMTSVSYTVSNAGNSARKVVATVNW